MFRATLVSIALLAIALFGFGSELSHATTAALRDSDTQSAKRSLLTLQRLGDQRAGTRFVFPVTAAGVQLDVKVDLTYVRVGRALSLVFCLGAGDTFSPRLRRDLIATQAGRLAA